MNAPVRRIMTQDQFFAWDGHQGARYEFDGFQPVAMTGGSALHSIIIRNLHRTLDARLRGSRCQYLGPDAGFTTVEGAVRYPDALVTCSKISPNAYTISGVVAVFEVISPSSVHMDRVVKVLEYAAVPSIRRYVILESTHPGATVFERSAGDQPWLVITRTSGDTLRMPEIEIEIPLAAFYEDVDFGDGEGTAPPSP